MNKNSILWLLFLSISITSCTSFKIQRPNGESRIYTKIDRSEYNLSEKQKEQIHPFNEANIHKQNKNEVRRFETITPEQLKTISNAFDKVCITYWHKCPSLLKHLQDSQYIADSLQTKLVIVAIDYELETLNQHLDSINYTSTVYIAKNEKKHKFKLKKRLQYTKHIIPETYNALLDLVIGISFIYFDNLNPENNFSSTPSRLIYSQPEYKKIKPHNALDVYFQPIY